MRFPNEMTLSLRGHLLKLYINADNWHPSATQSVKAKRVHIRLPVGASRLQDRRHRDNDLLEIALAGASDCRAGQLRETPGNRAAQDRRELVSAVKHEDCNGIKPN